MNYDIIVIGAGTSAGFLLTFLAEQETTRKLKILVLEKTKEPFRRIYGSGNGRCNFSNIDITDSSYYSISGSDTWKKNAFESASKLDLKQFFFNNGIPSYNDEFGRLMPYTNSAKTIVSFFERHLKSVAVEFNNYSKAVEILKNDNGFTVTYIHKKELISAQTHIVVYACGGSAYPQMGTDGLGFEILRKLGHTIIKQVAGIVPLETKETAFHVLAGLKIECKITIGSYSRKGELLFTKYGVSGPNVLYASNIVSLGLLKDPVKIVVDLLPEESFTLEYFRLIYSNAKEKTVIATFGGVLRSEFIKAFILQNSLKNSLSFNEVEKVYNKLKKLELTVNKTRPLKEAQVSLGGISVDEINPVSFESRLHKNLFIMGEAIDYTGGCGGYNIHWCAATARGVADAVATELDAAFTYRAKTP